MTVILIDAKNAMFRFGWVHKNLRTSDGISTGAVYGVLNCLLRLKKKYPSGRFVVVWDGDHRERSWRNQLFPGYKKRDGKLPEETVAILAQIPLVKKVLSAIGVSQAKVDEVEADDIIGMLTDQCLRRKRKVVIYSSDKDYLQFVHRGVHVIRDVNKEHKLAIEDAASIRKMFFCSPENVLKVRAFCGDPSDKIPGVLAKVGPATAAKLVADGFDPSQPVAYIATGHPYYERVLQVWDALRLNYRLMQIPGDCTDADMRARCLQYDIDRVLRELKSEPTKISYLGFVALLQSLELSQAMSARRELFAINENWRTDEK